MPMERILDSKISEENIILLLYQSFKDCSELFSAKIYTFSTFKEVYTFGSIVLILC